MDRHPMKKLLIPFLLAFALLSVWVLSQPVPGVPVNGPIVPTDYKDIYSTLDPWFAGGTFKDATNVIGLQSIPAARRVRGMIAYTSSDSNYWTLANDLTTWVGRGTNFGGGSGESPTGSGMTSGSAILTNSTIYRMFTPDPPHTATGTYDDHFAVNMRPNVSNAGNESLAVGNGPAKPIRLSNGNFLPVGDILANINYTLTFDSALDSFILENPSSGISTDPTLYSSVAGPQVTIGVATNALPHNRLVQQPTSTLLGNPTGAPGNTMPIGIVAPLQFVGTNLTVDIDEGGGGTGQGATIGTGTLTNSTIYRMFSPDPPYPTSAAYPDHFAVNMRPNVAGAGGERLAVGSGPPKDIRVPNGNSVPVGDMIANINYSLSFDAALDAFILENPSSGLVTDSTLYTSVDGPQVTIGVGTNALHLANLTPIAANRLLGNAGGVTANVQEISVAAPLAFSGGQLTVSGLGESGAVTIFDDYVVTNASGVSVIICDTTTNSITVTLPQDSEQRTITIFKKDSVANYVSIVNSGGDAYATGLGVTPIRLFLRGEYVRIRGIGSNLNMVLESQSIDLGTLNDMRNYTMNFRHEFGDNTVAAFWGQNGLSTASYTTDPSHGYVNTMTTGAATNGMGYIGLRNASAQLTATSPIVLTYDWMVTVLPTVTEYYVLEFGLGSALAATGVDLNDPDAVLFRYASMENGGKFRFRVCAGGIGNSIYLEDTTITPAIGVWYRVTILASTQRAWMFVNDAVIGPQTTGLPTAATMTIIGRIQKGVGTTPRLCTLDYFKSARPAIR